MAEISGYNPNINNNPASRQLNRPGDVAQTGGIKGSQRVQKALDNAAIEDAKRQQQQQPFQTIARRMTPRDVINQLLQMGIRPSQENRSLATKMLLSGLELSSENFESLGTLLSGLPKTASTEQAAILMVTKGLNSRAGTQNLAAFLEQNPELSKQMLEMLQASATARSALGQTSGLLSPQLSNQLAAMLSALDGYVSLLPKEFKDKVQKGTGTFSNAEILTNTRAVRALIDGVARQVQEATPHQTSEVNNLLTALGTLSKSAQNVAQNLIVQAILSRPDEREDAALQEKFSYWQIPYGLGNPAQTIELLLERDKKAKHRNINPRRTKLVLKTESEALGEISAEVEVEDDNLDFRFNTNDENIRKLISANVDELRKKLETYSYKTKTVRVVKRSLDVKNFLIPTLDFNTLTRVQTEV
ncbi:hypothetical protein NO2_0381 [Candidatus Termititenax persephonae]|uniref:Flagellar hook-length control protein-like C-terminal domain-containing protein n=1 Tax=Candidatus Termititenax persephonae TaxID=2218525 RepID=A0A388TGG7_9BACT|nr:hypothetical protein NO2_0381 [Candidatus Termititenax persephonae]